MSEECRNDCVEKLLFPKPIKNRPGLSHIDYRIGTYSDFLEALLRKLNSDPLLNQWTHREPDDPGIALLEGASIVGDILTFYQELYANEAYIRTAGWRESIADLVRLTGYLLSPGVGGKAVFAVEVKDKDSSNKPVTIPKSFPVKAQVKGVEQAVDFETIAEMTVFPALSKFQLYRPRRAMENIKAGSSSLEVHKVNGKNDFKSIHALDIKTGDRIMIVPDTSMFDKYKTYLPQQKAEILVVSNVKNVLDRTIIYFKGSLTVNRGTKVTAYPVGRSFSHFGHNVADKVIKYNDTKKEVKEIPTNFYRKIWGTHQESGADADFYSVIKEKEMPLDHEMDDLAAGGRLICQGVTKFTGTSGWVPFTVVKKINSLRSDSIKWGNVTGVTTVAEVDSGLIKNKKIKNEKIDIRQMKFHEVSGPKMVLRAPSAWGSGQFKSNSLNFRGTYDQVKTLPGRKVLFEGKEGKTFITSITKTSSGFSLTNKDKKNPWMWPIILGSRPKPNVFLLENFDEEVPRVTVYGNLVEADQGKTEKEVVLGNGDNSLKFQTFKLPKTPLTYHNQAGETPPEAPELKIYVNDRLWKRVSTFFGQKPKEEIYIVRENSEGKSWVQFGDGKTGARLPSGFENVKAVYRTGIGAYGALKDGTNPQPGGKVDRLDKVHMPFSASGGDEPEKGDNARNAAPGKTQALGRLVSLKDFESEALATPGVSKAFAGWEVSAKQSAVVLTLLMESGRAGDFSKVRDILNKYNICRGPQRFPVSVIQGKRFYIYIHTEFALDAAFKEDKVKDAIKKALGIIGDEGNGIDGSDGLFGLRKRRFRQNAYASRIEAIIQNVEGVIWAKVTALESLGEADDPSTLNIPAAPGFSKTIACDERHILCLYKKHLQLSVSKDETKGRC